MPSPIAQMRLGKPICAATHSAAPRQMAAHSAVKAAFTLKALDKIIARITLKTYSIGWLSRFGGKHKMSERKYNQDCALARASDLLGERWTLLIVRDLLIAPRRFGELETRLKGMGTNLLAKRLKDMQHARLVSGGEARSAYHLTEMGRALEPMVLQLVRWSLHWVRHNTKPAGLHFLDWDLLAFKSLFVPDPKMRKPMVARFKAGEWIAWIRIDQQCFAFGLGEPDHAPDVSFLCTVAGLRQADHRLSGMNPVMRRKARLLLSCFPLP